jgi:Holliday junction resolvase-like predicted endonuclease
MKGNKLHFIEVKTLTKDFDVIRETDDSHRAEENVHPAKIQRLTRVIQTYMLEKGKEVDWQFDVVTVLVSKDFNKAKVQFLENIVL